jgi:hypothetical protein
MYKMLLKLDILSVTFLKKTIGSQYAGKPLVIRPFSILYCITFKGLVSLSNLALIKSIAIPECLRRTTRCDQIPSSNNLARV